MRAALVRSKGNYEQATRTAVKVGIGISYAIMGFGFISIFTGSFVGGIWLILIGWFLQSGAQSYVQSQEITSALADICLQDIMNTRFVSLSPKMKANEAIDSYFNVYRKSELPVVVDEGTGGQNRLVGAITANSIFNVEQSNRQNVTVQDIMVDRSELLVMYPTDTADLAFKRMVQENKSRIYVCQQYDRLHGVISKTDILNIARERMEYATFGKKAQIERNARSGQEAA